MRHHTTVFRAPTIAELTTVERYVTRCIVAKPNESRGALVRLSSMGVLLRRYVAFLRAGAFGLAAVVFLAVAFAAPFAVAFVAVLRGFFGASSVVGAEAA